MLSVRIPWPKRHKRNALTANVNGEARAIYSNHLGKSWSGNKLPLNKCIIPISTIAISFPLLLRIVKFAARRDREKKNNIVQRATKSIEKKEATVIVTDLNTGKIKKIGTK